MTERLGCKPVCLLDTPLQNLERRNPECRAAKQVAIVGGRRMLCRGQEVAARFRHIAKRDRAEDELFPSLQRVLGGQCGRRTADKYA